jgi:hypothetical protein
MTVQAHRINIEADQKSVFDALSTAEGWSRWFTVEVAGDFTASTTAMMSLISPFSPATAIGLSPCRRGHGPTR